MRIPFRFVVSSKKAKLSDASQPLDFIELPKFEIPNDQQNHHTTGDSPCCNSKNFGSPSLECSQTLHCVAGATLSSQVTVATTTGTSTKQEKPTENGPSPPEALVHFVDSEGLLQAVAKPTNVSTGQKIKAAVVSYADSARKLIFRRRESANGKEFENSGPKLDDSPNSAETRVGVQTETKSEAGPRSSASAQTQTTHKSSRVSRIFHYQNKKRKARTSRKSRIIAAKKRRAKRRITRSGKVLLPVPRNLEAWEDIKQNVKQPNDKGYDLKFDYNKILKPSFVENWLDATVNPLVSALPLSVEQLGNGQIEYANDFEKEADEPARLCANCKQDPTGALGLGNCDTCYYFLKSERQEFLKYGDAKNIKGEFDAHAACPFMSSDVEDSFASTGDSMLGICLMPILGLWEKMDRKIFHAKISFRQFRESVPVWSRNVRAAANKGYGWRSVRPAKCGPQPKTWGDLLPQDFSPRYDQFWPQDYSPAQFYEINVNEPPRPKDAVFVKVSYPDPEPELPHVSWYSLHCALKRCWLDRKQKQRVRNLAIAKASTNSVAKVEEKTKAKPRVTFAKDVHDSKKATISPTLKPKADVSRNGKDSTKSDFLGFFGGAEATGNPNKVWASVGKVQVSAFTPFNEVDASTDNNFSTVSNSTVTLERANEFEVLGSANGIHVEEVEAMENHFHKPDIELTSGIERGFGSSPVVPKSPKKICSDESWPIFCPPSSLHSDDSESANEPAPENPDVLKDVVQQIDKMLESLGYSSNQQSASDAKVSNDSFREIFFDQSDNTIHSKQSTFVASAFCDIASFESDAESSIEEIYTRGSGGRSSPQCNQSLTEDLITEILSRYKQGKFDQDHDPKAGAETLGDLLHEVFKGVNNISEDFETNEKVPSNAYSEHDDSHRFTLLSDSEDELDFLELSSAHETKSECNTSIVGFKPPCLILKRLKLVSEKCIEKRGEDDKLPVPVAQIMKYSALATPSIEKIQPVLKHFKLPSHIPKSLPTANKFKPFKILGLVVEPLVSQALPPVKSCLHPVIIRVVKPAPRFSSQTKYSKLSDSKMKETFCESYTKSALEQEKYFADCHRFSTDVEAFPEMMENKTSKVITERFEEALSSLKFIDSLKNDGTLSPEITDRIRDFNPSEQIEEKAEYSEVTSSNPNVLFEICRAGDVSDADESNSCSLVPEKLILDCEIDSASEFGGSMDEELNRAAFFDYLEDSFTIPDESLWNALSLDDDFDRKLAHKNNCDDGEIELVRSAKESLPKMTCLLEIDAANFEEYDVDFTSKRTTKVHFKEEEQLCKIEVVDRHLAPKTINGCSSNFKVSEKSILKYPSVQELGRFISVKQFSQIRDDRERKETEMEMWTKVDECHEVFSNLKGKQDADQLQDMFDQFLESFKFSRENFAEVATIQILRYTDWLAHIKRSISGAMALTSGVGSRFILLLGFVDSTGKSDWSISRAERDTQGILDSLSTVAIMMDQVQEAILQLRLEFPEYVGAMAEISEAALKSRQDLLEIYSMFCLSNLESSTDISSVHYCTGYETFMQKTKFLSDQGDADYEVTFATALNDLQRSHDIVSQTGYALGEQIKSIMRRLSSLKLEFEKESPSFKRLSQETAVSMTASPSELSLGGQTLASQIEDISRATDSSIPGINSEKSQEQDELKANDEPKSLKSKFEVPKWMKFKGFGKKPIS